MPYDEALDERIREVVDRWPRTTARKMFGGVCHLLAGNMFCGVYKDFLVLRLGESAAAEALEGAHTRPFDITGRPMKGWVMVAPEGTASRRELETWLGRAREFAGSLPSK